MGNKKINRAQRPLPPAELAECIEFLPLAIAVIDLDGSLRYMNKAFETRSGVSRESGLGGQILTKIGLKKSDYEVCMVSIAKGDSWNGRWISVLENSSVWIQEVIASPVRNEAQLVDGCMLVIRDLTEDDTLAERLRRDSSMSAINSLAAGVAHEINNPLSFIVGNVAYLLEEFEGIRETVGDRLVEEWGAALEDLQEGADRVRDIVHQLGGMSNEVDAGLREVELDTLLDNTLALVQNQIRHRARLVREYTECGRAWTNASLLSQVLLNLLLNAAESMAPGQADINELRIVLKPGSQGNVTIEVRDTGIGISDDSLPHIFDPFFSTKPIGDGTGMGLTVARRLVGELGGHITVRSIEGQGSSFIISLPNSGVVLVQADAKEEESHAWQTKIARILVVDDEVAVLRMVDRILSRHDVVVCDEGKEALRLLEEEEFDLILCDLMMPEISGEQLYRQVEKEHPDIAERFVFITGGAFTPSVLKFVRTLSNRVIEKPFTPTQLRELVAKMVRS